MDSNDFIYLDYAAATPVDSRVFEAMKPFFSENFFNPSASYLPAKHVRKIYEEKKDELAHTIGAKGNDLVITAGATESINLAFTVLKNYKNANCLISKIEHASVREAAKNFAAEVREIEVDKTGYIDLKDLTAKIDDNTVLISVAIANNEIGTIEPLSEISEIIKKVRMSRLSRGIETPIYLHSDASQAMSLIDIYVSRLGVDMLTINSAKVYGPKGIGALYVTHGIKLSPITFGGGQEMGLRSGTENVAGLVGFATAAKIAKEHVNGNRKKYEKLANLFKKTLEENLDKKVELKYLGNKKHQLASFIPICLDGVDAERLIYLLENEGIYVSTGAACAASKGKKSHVLKAIGLTDSEIAGSIRISLGMMNDEENVALAAKKIARVVNELEEVLFEDFSERTSVRPLGRASEARNKPRETRNDGRRATACLKKELPSNSNNGTVFVGMSGGVDSSVSAVLLKEQGYHVVGVYMKNWSKDLPGMKCPWAEDLADAKRVATKLGIEFMVFDFENEYKQKVVDYMLAEFKKGNTPNPDVMCNQEIKFKLFYDISREKGADFIATGHYAKSSGDKLLKAVDENKDQTYFLYRISKDAISHTIFPIGDMEKPDVKKLAAKKGLDNAYKKESMGVCFVGDVGMKDFLKEYLKSTEDKEKYLKPGKIIERETGETLGFHDGAIFFTIGQRHGLNVGGGLPYYVVGKDMDKNEVYVSKNLNDENLWVKTLELKNVILRESLAENTEVEVRLRHRAKLEKAVIKDIAGDVENGTGTVTLEFEDEIKKTASGQSAVIYKDEVCLGGGILK